MIEAKVTTIMLDGSEQAVEFSQSYPYFCVTNFSDDTVYVSLQPNIVEDANGVYPILAGRGHRIGNGGLSGKIYIKGTGKITVEAQGIAHIPSFLNNGEGGEAPYTLPTMSETVKGGAKVGDGLEVDENGVLSAKQAIATYFGQSGIIENTVESPAYITDFPVNLLEITANTSLNYGESGVDFIVDKKAGTVTLSGTSTKWTSFTIGYLYNCNNGDTYFLSGFPKDIQAAGNRLSVTDNVTASYNDDGDGVAYSYNNESFQQFVIWIAPNTSFENCVIKPMVVKGSVSRGFIPYSGGTIRTIGSNGEGSEIFVSPNTPKPVTGLKTFSGITNIISDFDISLAYFKSKKDAAPTEALQQEIDYLNTYSGQSGTIENTVEAPSYITDFPVNLLETTVETQEKGNIRFTVDKASGTITVNSIDGQPTSQYITLDVPFSQPFSNGNNYYFSGCPAGGSGNTYNISVGCRKNGNFIKNVEDDGNGIPINFGDYDDIYRFTIVIGVGYTPNNLVFRPCLVKGSKYQGFIPYGGGTIRAYGRNLLSPGRPSVTIFGVEVTVDDTLGTVTFNATETRSNHLDFPMTINKKIKNGERYYLSGCPEGGSSSTYMVRLGGNANDTGSGKSFVVTNDDEAVTEGRIYIRIDKDYIPHNLVFRPMLAEGSEPVSFEPYRESKIFVSPDTEKPVAGLRTFDGVTHITSDFDIEMKYFKDAEKAIPDAALENKVNDINTTIFSGTASESAPAEITNHTSYKYLLVRLANSTAGILTADDIATLTDTATVFTVGSETYSAKISSGVLQMWSDGNLTIMGVK